jgi:hypothetical protein
MKIVLLALLLPIFAPAQQIYRKLAQLPNETGFSPRGVIFTDAPVPVKHKVVYVPTVDTSPLVSNFYSHLMVKTRSIIPPTKKSRKVWTIYFTNCMCDKVKMQYMNSILKNSVDGAPTLEAAMARVSTLIKTKKVKAYCNHMQVIFKGFYNATPTDITNIKLPYPEDYEATFFNVKKGK